LIRERLEADCTPYAVHGDGVQVSSVISMGLQVYQLNNAL